MLNILVLSDEAKSIYSLFRSAGYTPELGDVRKDAPPSSENKPLQSDQHDIAFLDLDTGNWEERLLDLRHAMPVIAFAHADLKKAVAAMRLGACDFLEKPLTTEALNEIISRHKKQILNSKFGFDEIIGTSPSMQVIFGLIKKAAASESNVLITGDSGTGKELIARAIHRWSPRNEKAFMTINCSAIPDTLLESELFGFEKGAFTGAQYQKKGLLEMADGGTVFFDEIGDVSPLFQTKILRVLQEGEIMRIGGMRQLKVDLRFITATHRDLKALSNRGAFREDLYYRLNVINIHLPPLRERLEDVPVLAKHFLQHHAPKRKDILIKCIGAEAMNLLLEYSFPGNVRELENIIERAISFANTSEILPDDLPEFLRHASLKKPAEKSPSSPRLKDALSNIEKETITEALRENNGNISRAAAALGIYRQQLQRKIKQYNIVT
ncbi:MAG TPA: sigma-54 dependent transcriptional regulator [Nitrospirota bacterium]|nr:sigma-54 dependent transcriptional regulator [Nitrospirota bacterium]